jgi:alkylation response protein AidB-like acyl-CoA dehydrogenase
LSAFLLIDKLADTPSDRSFNRELADLIATEQAMKALNLRQVQRALSGSGPGPEGNVTKLVSSEHMQHTAELWLRIDGEKAVGGDDPSGPYMYLASRAITIAGGTSEINRNVIAERLLGLPREDIKN